MKEHWQLRPPTDILYIVLRLQIKVFFFFSNNIVFDDIFLQTFQWIVDSTLCFLRRKVLCFTYLSLSLISLFHLSLTDKLGNLSNLGRVWKELFLPRISSCLLSCLFFLVYIWYIPYRRANTMQILQFSVDFTILWDCVVFSCLFIDEIQTLEKFQGISTFYFELPFCENAI